MTKASSTSPQNKSSASTTSARTRAPCPECIGGAKPDCPRSRQLQPSVVREISGIANAMLFQKPLDLEPRILHRSKLFRLLVDRAQQSLLDRRQRFHQVVRQFRLVVFQDRFKIRLLPRVHMGTSCCK